MVKLSKDADPVTDSMINEQALMKRHFAFLPLRTLSRAERYSASELQGIDPLVACAVFSTISP
jgi:hypothetical protein